MKRIIAILIILCLSFDGVFHRTIIFAQNQCEYSDEMLDIARDILIKLKVWDEIEQNNTYITRAEVAKIMSRLIGIEENESIVIENIYDDVPPSHWAYRWIHHIASFRVPCNNGFIGAMCGDGYGTFRPDDYITYQELAKVLVVLLGWFPYVEYSAKTNGSSMHIYPDGFYETANLLGIYPLNENEKTFHVTKNDAIIIIYNAINVTELSRMLKSPGEWYEQTGNSIMESRMNVFQVRGYFKIIDENSFYINGKKYAGKVNKLDFDEGLVICFYEMDFYMQNEDEINSVISYYPISSLDFDKPKLVSNDLPKNFQK